MQEEDRQQAKEARHSSTPRSPPDCDGDSDRCALRSTLTQRRRLAAAVRPRSKACAKPGKLAQCLARSARARAPDSRNKAISPITSSASSASLRGSSGLPQESPKRPQVAPRIRTASLLPLGQAGVARASLSGYCNGRGMLEREDRPWWPVLGQDGAPAPVAITSLEGVRNDEALRWLLLGSGCSRAVHYAGDFHCEVGEEWRFQLGKLLIPGLLLVSGLLPVLRGGLGPTG
jgi:hypothetical protein